MTPQQAPEPMHTARAGVLAAVDALGEAGGPSLRPAAVTSGNRRWESRQAWLGPLSGSRERRLTLVACEVVARIERSPAWTSPELADHREQLDLLAELEQLDVQAFRLAHAGTAPGEVWLALVDRVAALHGYAGRLDELGREPEAGEPDPGLLTGAAHDELAADRVHALAAELAARRITTSGWSPGSAT